MVSKKISSFVTRYCKSSSFHAAIAMGKRMLEGNSPTMIC